MFKNLYETSIDSPSYPAAWLLFGMLFGLAVAYFMATPWTQSATVSIYVVAFAWVSVLAWRERLHILSVTVLDVLFVIFILVVLASLIFQDGFGGSAGKFARYLPFMMLIPYLCGRMMRVSDIALLNRIILIACVIMLPLLLIDRFMSPVRATSRWHCFGQDYGTLLAGALLASALVAFCVHILDCRKPGKRNNRPNQFIHYGLIGLVTAFLVWVTARGWLLAGLAGVAVTCLLARHRSITARLGLLASVLVIVGLSLWGLPKIDPQFGRLYAMSMDLSSRPKSALDATAGPILGDASCQPLKAGVDSIAIRMLLYREAVAMFIAYPSLGVGAARFGEHSCTGNTGPGGYPHSTILQGFAELGLIGGGLLTGLLVLTAVTLTRPFLSTRQGSNWSADAFVLALFAAFLFADQIYGNYFMAVGTWLIAGITASMRAERRSTNRG